METSALALLKKPWVLIALLVLFCLPFTTSNIHFHHVLIMFMIFATLSQAWNVIGGFAGQVSFGHATFFGIGAYAALVLLKRFDLSPWVGMLIGGAIPWLFSSLTINAVSRAASLIVMGQRFFERPDSFVL